MRTAIITCCISNYSFKYLYELRTCTPTHAHKLQSKIVEEATKPNSSQLPQELYSEVFNALPKGMAPKVVRKGMKN